MHYNRGQIASEAEAIVNNTALGTVTDSIINRVLYKLYTNYEWGFLTSSTTVTFSSATASAGLPSDYLGHLHCKWRDTSASPIYEHNLAWIDYSKYLMINTPLQVAAQPKVYTISPQVRHGSAGAVGNLLIWPTFETTSNPNCTLIYFALPTQVVEGTAGDGAVPLFQNHAFLVEATVNELWNYMRDPRHDPNFIGRNIGDVRSNMMDFGAVSVPEVGLDPRRFKSHRGRFG